MPDKSARNRCKSAKIEGNIRNGHIWDAIGLKQNRGTWKISKTKIQLSIQEIIMYYI